MKNLTVLFITGLFLSMPGGGLSAVQELIWDEGTTPGGTAVFSTNSPAGTFFFKVTTSVSENSAGYWRSVLTVTAGEANLYLMKGEMPTLMNSDACSTNTGNDSIILPLEEAEEWYLMVSATEESQWSLFAGDMYAENLIRDGAAAETGSATLGELSAETVPFNGGSTTVTNVEPNNWVFYNVEVPSPGQPDSNFLGWELRVTDWGGEVPPIMVVCRNSLPSGVNNQTDENQNWDPESAVLWPEQYQWATASSPKDWTGYSYEAGHVQRYAEYLLSMAKERPLEPGSYFIGFYNPSSDVATTNVTFTSRMIGSGGAYPVSDVAFEGGAASIPDLPARGVAYFKVSVPSNAPSWNVQLENISGESMLYIRKDFVPTWEQIGSSVYSPDAAVNELVKLQKPGDEHYTLMPGAGETVIPEGDYYLMVVSEGVDPAVYDIGTGLSSAVLHSLGTNPVVNLGELQAETDLSAPVQYDGGDIRLYQFTVDSGDEAVELRLSDLVGSPNMNLLAGFDFPANNGESSYYGGMFSGYISGFDGQKIITIPNAATGVWSLVVSDPNKATLLTDGSCSLTISSLPTSDLNADSSMNSNGISHVISGSLADSQSRFFKVEIPELFDGEPVLGWYLTADTTQGEVLLRARQGSMPDEINRTQTGWGEGALMVVPPFLTPGTWLLELKGSGATSYTLTSRFVAPQRTWAMPEAGRPVTTPGLSAPLFGDTGVGTNGIPLADDQGIDLNCGYYDVYAVTVPGTNAGLLSTRLEAISGNPDLYIRQGDVPTLYHDTDKTGGLYDHVLDSEDSTQCGNWVPLDGRNKMQLNPGTWFVMVKADGTSDARYRLKLSGGNVYSGGNVQDLPLASGSYSEQVLAEGDWRYYRVMMPDPVPAQWNFGVSMDFGDVDLYLRDTLPPGNNGTFSDSNSNITDWRKDNKMAGEESWYPTEGIYTLPDSMLIPGKTYYLGLLALEDSSFNVSSSVSGGSGPLYPVIDFYNGAIVTNIPSGHSITYRVNAPEDAVRWVHSVSNSAGVTVYLKQSSRASSTDYDWRLTSASGSLNKFLMSEIWPWMSGEAYYLTATNTGTDTASFTLTMAGSSATERPTRVAASDGTQPDFIQVTWSGVSGAWGYDIWRSPSPAPETAALIDENVSGTFNDYAATPGITNYYWIALTGTSETNWFSDSDSGWFSTTGALSQDSFDFGYEGGTGTLTVAAPDELLWSATESLSWIELLSPIPGEGYGSVEFMVAMSAGETARTGTVMVAGNPVTIIQAAYGVPGHVLASDGLYSDQVVVTWDALPDAVSYNVYRAETDDPAERVSQRVVSTNEYIDVSIQPNITYYYWVRAYNAGGVGGYSASDAGSSCSSALTIWLNQYYPDGYTGDDQDDDADGFCNADEFIAGTNPTNAASYFSPVFTGVEADGTMVFEVAPAVSGRVYGLQWCDGLDDADWKDTGLNQHGHDDVITLPYYSSDRVLFLRPTVRRE